MLLLVPARSSYTKKHTRITESTRVRTGTLARLVAFVAVPSVFEAACPEIKYYTGMGWYRRAFRLPVEWRGRRIVLHFEAVNYRAKGKKR